jgi:recombination protein RecA
LTAAFIDAEHALDPRYAHACGVDLAKLLVAQPDTAEQVFDCARDLVASGAVGLLVIDSTAALRPRVETEDAFGDHHQGLHARAMSKACRLLCSLASNHDCCVIFLSQLEPVYGVTFGPSEVPTGGNSLKFYASIRIELQLLGRTDDGAPRIRARVQKNKLAPPFRTAAFAINCGRLVDIEVSP